MLKGLRGTFVISWGQTELDGVRGAPPGALMPGAEWRWTGEAVRVDGPAGLLVLHGAVGAADLHRRAARVAQRLTGRAGRRGWPVAALPSPGGPGADHSAERGAEAGAAAEPDPDLPDASLDLTQSDGEFTVTDGLTGWRMSVIEPRGSIGGRLGGAARGPIFGPTGRQGERLVAMSGAMPPPGTDLWVVERSLRLSARDRADDADRGMLCFTPGTLIDTPCGRRPVEAIRPGEMVLTRDDGPRPVIWTGQRRMSGARLHALPRMRPVRIRAGAAGCGMPDRDLVVSPRHRMLLTGPRAQALFGSPEVLVAAEDLIDDLHVHVDHGLREVTYVHLLLERHQILRANGVDTESFHPDFCDPAMLDPGQAADLAGLVAGGYGPATRRCLSRPEAAILCHA